MMTADTEVCRTAVDMRSMSAARPMSVPARFRGPRTAAPPARAAAAVLAAAWLAGVSAAEPSPDPASAAREEVEALDCIIEPYRVVEVGSAAVGVLEDVRAERGTRVAKGQVLAVLESGVERAAVDLARLRASVETEVAVRRVTYAFQASNQRRADRLHATRAVAEQTREEAEHDARVSALRVRQAQEEKRLAELELVRAEQALARRTIRSPIDGVVMERHRSEGERIEEQPVVTLAQLHPLRVEVVLPVERFGSVRAGTRARVVPEHGPGGAYEARVSAVDPVLDAASGTFGVRLEMPNEDHALPGGLRCRLEFLPGPVEPPAPAAKPDPEAPSRPVDAPQVAPAQSVVEADAASAPRAPARQAEGLRSARVQPEETPLAAAAADGAMPSGAASPPEARSAARPAERPPAGNDDATAIAVAGTEGSQGCQALGPLDSEAEARRLRRALAGTVGASRILTRRVDEPVGFLVLVDPTAFAGGTEAVVEKLQGEGIRDYQVLRSRGGSVSVGYFKGERTARGRAARIEAIGLPVEVAPRTKERRRFFLEVEFDPTRQADGRAAFERVLGNAGFAASSSSPCRGMVTARR